MSDSSNSCLIEKLSHYIDLDETAQNHLAALEEETRRFPRHHEVYTEGEETQRLYVIKSGWLYAYTDLIDGRRQIVRVMHPGDIIGFPDLAFDNATVNVRASEDVELCPFPKRKLDVIFTESPRLAALLFTLANREIAFMVDILRALGRMNARERLAFFFLDTISRLRITNKAMTNTMRMPMNQHEIGDLLGLTHTYVSKTIREMEDEGLISRTPSKLTLEREGKLRDMIDFTERHDKLDTSWFPKG